MRRGDDERFALQNRIRLERLRPRRLLERNGHLERRAFALLALDPDVAAHHLGELAADGKAKARAAVLARGGIVDLRKRLEKLVDLVGGNADAGIAHGKQNERLPELVLCALDRDADVAL